MKKTSVFLLVLILSCTREEPGIGVLTNLNLKRALPLDGLQGAEPSGLTMFNNELFTISDDHDDTIFRIRIQSDIAVLEPYVRFELSKPAGIKKFDFEGITCDESGNFYLASESTYRVLRISHDGSEVSWITDELKSAGQEKGLFQKKNANLEGIVYLGDGEFVLCSERESRGIIRFKAGDAPQDMTIIPHDKSVLEHPPNRHPDFTGLSYFDGSLFILERGAHAVTEIETTDGNIIEKRAWSYEEIEKSQEFGYVDTRYGRGEGLYVDQDNIFIVIDNNGESRRSDQNDERPLLLIMERPQK